jgi:hypothetical protein
MSKSQIFITTVILFNTDHAQAWPYLKFFIELRWVLVNKKKVGLRPKGRGRLFSSPSGSEDVTASFGPFFLSSGTMCGGCTDGS